jgi:hypothetical protein
MSSTGWDDYLSNDESSTAEPADSGTEVALDDASNDTSDAALAADWGNWQAATGDEQAQSADSYLTAAEQDMAQGGSEYGDQMLYDAEAQAGLASDSYGTAADSYGSAASSLDDAGADVASVSSDVSEESEA